MTSKGLFAGSKVVQWAWLRGIVRLLLHLSGPSQEGVGDREGCPRNPLDFWGFEPGRQCVHVGSISWPASFQRIKDRL